MAVDLYDAHRQWANRMPDERFDSISSLYDFVYERQFNSTQSINNLSDTVLHLTSLGGISVNGSSRPALLTNWAFSQLCRTVGAPARYLRNLPGYMARDCLQYGIKNSNLKYKILLRDDDPEFLENSQLWASAITSPSYGRIWDSDIVEKLMDAVDGTGWHLPPSYSGKPSGLYASDRDMFAFFINDEQPIEINNAKLGKGFFCWNSETGASSFGLTTFLYNHVCGNHIVWGAENVNELRIVHKKSALDRFYSDAIPVLNRFVENKKVDDSIKYKVDKAMHHRIGKDLEEITNWFKNKPFTKKEIVNAYDTATKTNENPHNLWGIVQGLTSNAKNIPYTNQKTNLEKRAGTLLDNIACNNYAP